MDFIKKNAKKIMKWAVITAIVSSLFYIFLIMTIAFMIIVNTNNHKDDNCNDIASATDVSNVVTSADMEKNAEQIYEFVMSHVEGATPEGVCGMLGNFQQESSLNPKSIEVGTGAGHGLAQWTAGRWTNLQNFAKEHNKSWDDLGLQLEYLLSELKGSEKAGVKSLKLTNVEEATLDWERTFERAGVPAVQNRVKFAQHWYSKFKGKQVDKAQSDDLITSTGDATEETLACGGDDDYTGSGGEWVSPVKNYTGGHNDEQDFGHCASRTGGWHDGLDYGSSGFSADKNLYAVHDGKVKSVSVKGQGLGVYLVLDVGDREVAYQEFAGNTDAVFVKAGDEVKAGQKIAELQPQSGMSGIGTHLHLGITKKGGNAEEGLGHAFSDDGYWEDPLKILGGNK